MKKCPTCEKTFDDNLKFCQSDGTPLVVVEEAPPEDPYKTTVANQSDLPIPPLDPFKTIVGSPPVPEATPEPVEEVKEEEFDPMRTVVSTEMPFLVPDEPKEAESSAPETPVEVNESKIDDIQAASPEPPKFSEPDINPPTFGEIPVEAEVSAEKAPEAEEVEPPVDADNVPPSQNDLTGASPYGDQNNVPIPSPFDQSLPPSFELPKAPMPAYKEEPSVETPAAASPFESPFGQADQQIEPAGWTPPPSPNSGWGEQQIQQNTPFQPAATGATGPSSTLAVSSLICGIVSLLSLGGSIIPFLGIICGIGSLLLAIAAIVTGFLGRSRAKNKPEEYGGAGLALGGIITGALTLLGMIGLTILAVLVIGFSNLR